MGIEQILSRLTQLEQIAGNDPEKLAELEQVYEAGAQTLRLSHAFLRQRNRFRIRHLQHMRIRRPRMLFGGRYFSSLNFQTAPALLSADTVILSFEDIKKPVTDVDILHFNPVRLNMSHLMQALPAGFTPDLYFNYQVCTCRQLISGMESAPFPTVANFCHMFMARSCLEISRLFDFVLPLSPVLSGYLKKNIDPEKVIDVPFGLAWGHFSDWIRPPEDGKRDIDVLLSFSAAPDSPQHGNTRNTVHRLFREAEVRFGHRFRFVWPEIIDKTEYIKLLRRSRIVLNVAGIHGPYNYRTCEAIAAGAMMMQLEPDYISGPQHMDQFLIPGEEYVSFREDDFMSKLETLLEDEPRRAEIARRGMKRMETDCSYQALYSRLFQELAPRLKGAWKARRISPQRAVLARTGHQIQLLSVPRMQNRGEICLSVWDIEAILTGSAGQPCAVLLALYPRLPNQTREYLLGRISDQQPDGEVGSPGHILNICSQLFRNIPHPSLVDEFNFALISAQCGAMDQKGVKDLLKKLDAQNISLSQEEMLRVQTQPSLSGMSKNTERSYCIRIYNYPALFSDREKVHIAAAVDYMRALLFEVLKRAEPENDAFWQAKAEGVLAQYPVEGPAPAYMSEIPPERDAAE